MGTPREEAFDKRLIPAADRINGTVPDRRYPDGRPVQVAMEDTTFSKADGAYQNGLLKDIAALIERGHKAQGLILESVQKLDSNLLALKSVVEAKEAGTVDAEAVAAQLVEVLGEGLAEEVAEVFARRLGTEGVK